MKLESVYFHPDHTQCDGSVAATVTLKDKSHLSVWFDPETFELQQANSVPADSTRSTRANYRERDLFSQAGRRLVTQFRDYARINYPIAVEHAAHEKAAHEEARIAKISAEHEAHRQAAIHIVVRTVSYLDAERIVAELMDAKFIARDGLVI